MKIKCEYCGTLFEDTAMHCPSCGAPNPNQKQDKAPKTIEELKEWYKARNLPPEETTRFFIGKDIKEARAFGIYKDEHGEFVVYKNKADGSRAIRYKGKDEAYAVNELYQKLKDEIVHQKNLAAGRKSSAGNNTYRGKNPLIRLLATRPITTIIVGIMIIGTLMSVVKGIRGVHNGYYFYNGNTYYDYYGTWLVYEAPYYDDYDSYSNDWTVTEKPFSGNQYDDYFVSEDWNSNIPASDFEDSTYYEDHHSSSSDSSWSSDSDYDWDSGSDWDSGGSDWDSDW